MRTSFGVKQKTNVLSRIMLVRFSSFSQQKHIRNHTIPFDLKHIQTWLLQQNKQVCHIDQVIEPNLALQKTVQDFLPDLIILSGTLLDKESVIAYAKTCKEVNKNSIIVVSGQGVTSYPELYLSQKEVFDIALFGEIEQDAVTLLEMIEHGDSIVSIRDYFYNAYVANGPSIISDLDQLPYPQYSQKEKKLYTCVYPIKTYKPLVWGHMMTSRGCPRKCVFCSPVVRKSYGTSMRYRSAKSIFSEMIFLKESGINIIDFIDDNFTVSTAHVKRLCVLLIKNNSKMPWIAHARIDEVSEDLLKEMKKAGCVLLRFGVESGEPRILQLLNKTTSLSWREKSKHVFSLTRKIGIATNALFMIGNPTETKQEVETSIAFAKELDPDMIQVHYYTDYNELAKKDDVQESSNHYQKPVYSKSNMKPDELSQMYKNFYREMYLRKEFIARAYQYIPFFLFNSRILKSMIAQLLFIGQGKK